MFEGTDNKAVKNYIAMVQKNKETQEESLDLKPLFYHRSVPVFR